MMKAIQEYDAYFFKKENKHLFGIKGSIITPIQIIDQDGDIVKLIDFNVKSKTISFAVGEIEAVEKEVEGETVTVNETIEKFYQQKNGKISEVKSFDEKTKKSKQQLKHYQFNIETGKYKDYDVSDVTADFSDLDEKNKKVVRVETGLERFGTVDAYFHVEGVGLWFNTPDGRKETKGEKTYIARVEGLYFWGVDHKNLQLIIRGEGELFS